MSIIEGPYTLDDHHSHMQTLLANKSERDVITISRLVGQAPVTDELYVLTTRKFIDDNRRILGLRLPEFDKFVRERSRSLQSLAIIHPDGTLDATETPAYIWVDATITAMGCTVDPAGSVLHPKLTGNAVFDSLVALNSAREEMAFPEGALGAVFRLNVAERRGAALEAFKEHISAALLNPTQRDQVFDRLIDLMRVASSDASLFNAKEAALLIRKFIHQVKRKLHGLPIFHHLMLVLNGDQDGGKSSFAKMIFAPVLPITAFPTLAALTDERNIQMFDAFVGFVDELDKATRVDVDSLKAIVTAEMISRRPMKRNGFVNVRQNLTLIGTCNKTTQELIADETGNRRFAQIGIIGPSHEQSKQMWRSVNEFPWLTLWRAVDEQDEDPIDCMLDSLRVAQAAERVESGIELWVEQRLEEAAAMHEANATALTNNNSNHARQRLIVSGLLSESGDLTPVTAFTGEIQTTTELYEDYRRWETNFGGSARLSKGAFDRQMKRLAGHRKIRFVSSRTAQRRGYRYLG